MFWSIYTLVFLLWWITVALCMLWSCLGLHFEILIILNSFDSFKFSNMDFCECYIYILFTQDKSCSLVISLMSFMMLSYFIISAVTAWWLISFRNCSFSLLSISLYLHSATMTLSLPIHASAYSSEWLTNLQYCSVNIASFSCGLNFH